MKKAFLLLFLCFSGSLLAQNLNQLRQQIIQYNTEIAKAQSRKDLKSQAFHLNKLAYLYWTNKIYPDAIKTFGQLLNVETQLGNRQGMMEVHNNLGIIYKDLGKFKQSLAEFRLALPIAQVLRSNEKIYEMYHQTATVLASLGRNNEALADLEKALWMAQSMKNKALEKDTYFRISRFYAALGNKTMEMAYYKRFAAVLVNEQQKEINKQNIENQNQAKTLTQVKDSLQNTADSLERAEEDNKRKDLNIKTLNQQKKIAELEANEKALELRNEVFRRNLILGFAAVLLLMGFFLFRDYRKIQELNKQSSIQKQEIIGQNQRLEQSQKKLLEAQNIIQEQNLRLQSYNRDLEKQVRERTADLQKAYQELLIINYDLDTLTYRASHDLKTPVSSLEGLCNVALLEISDQNPAQEYFVKIKNLAANMSGLLDHLSKLRDIKHTHLKITEFAVKDTLQKVIDNNIKPFSETDSVRFLTKVDDGILLRTDEDLFGLVLKNIIQNAVQFSLPAGKNHRPYIRIEDFQTDTYAEIKVIDNGEGISDEAAPRIFNMFFRGSLRSKGAGLGLYTAKAAAEKLGGTIEYSQSPEKETIFTIRIPKIV